MKTIKKITEGILTIIACCALFGMTAEAETIGLQVVITLGSACILYVCYKLIEKINPSIKEEDRV